MARVVCGTQSFESIQAVLFDKDGTLADVEDYLRQVGERRWQHLCRAEPQLNTEVRSSFWTSAFGLLESGLDPAGLLAVGSRQENEVVAAAILADVGWGWIAAVEAAKTSFNEAQKDLAPKVEKTPLLAGVADLLSRLDRAGVKVGIVSADLHSEVAAFVEFYGLDEVMWFCGAERDRIPKTHPDFLKFACEEIGVTSQNTLVVGDSASDLLLASCGAAGFVAMVGGWTESVEVAPKMSNIASQIPAAKISHLSQVEVFA